MTNPILLKFQAKHSDFEIIDVTDDSASISEYVGYIEYAKIKENERVIFVVRLDLDRTLTNPLLYDVYRFIAKAIYGLEDAVVDNGFAIVWKDNIVYHDGESVPLEEILFNVIDEECSICVENADGNVACTGCFKPICHECRNKINVCPLCNHKLTLKKTSLMTNFSKKWDSQM